MIIRVAGHQVLARTKPCCKDFTDATPYGPSQLDRDIPSNAVAEINFKLHKRIFGPAGRVGSFGDEGLPPTTDEVLLDNDTTGVTIEFKSTARIVNVTLFLDADDASNQENDEAISIRNGRLRDNVGIVVKFRPHGTLAQSTNAAVRRLPGEAKTPSRDSQPPDMGNKEGRLDPAVGQKAGSAQLPSGGQGKKEFEADYAGQENVIEGIVRENFQSASFDADPATYLKETVKEPEKVTNFLLRLPYDVRRIIYDYFYPVARNIQLTNGPPEWNALTPRREAHGITSDGLNLLLVCREINQEIKQLLYGKNTFLVAPGERDFPCPRFTRPPYGNSRLFLSKLLLSTKQMVKTLHLCLGPSLHRNVIGKLPGQLAGFGQVVITVDPLNLTKPASRAAKQRCILDACRLIAAARSGLPPNRTFWDDCGDAATARMLDQVLPHGFSSVIQ